MHSICVIHNRPQKLALERKNSQIHLSASPVIEEEQPCCPCLEEPFAEKKKFICLPRFVKKQFHIERTSHQISADPPSSLGLRSSSILVRLKFQHAPCVTSCPVLWFSAVLLLVWGDCNSSELMDC